VRGNKILTIVDRRDVGNVRKALRTVALVEIKSRRMIFEDDWRFPVPAVRRRYYDGEQELTVEEIGMVPGTNKFRFAASYVQLPHKKS